MECCHVLSVCHSSLSLHHTGGLRTAGLELKRKRELGCGDGRRLRISATSTLPSSPGSSRRVSHFQEPRRLLQTKDLKNMNVEGLEPTLQSNGLEPSTSGREWPGSGNAQTHYTIQLTTSNEDRSGLSITNAGIMLSLIGEGGEALVQRILPVKENSSPGLRFQRGAVDVVHFSGPNLGRVSAIWIAPEAGTWRLEQVTVTMMPCNEHGEAVPKAGLFHMFKGRDCILLGDGEDLSAVELKPSQVFECDGPDDPAVIAAEAPDEPPKTPQESAKLREASMREYESLKVFLLGSTAAMVGAGTLGLSLLGAQDLAQGFAVGGAGGLLYLLLIQRAVDQIPSPQSSQDEDQADSSAKKKEAVSQGSVFSSNMKVKTPAASFALIVGLALVVTRASQASTVISLPPRELLAGAFGFFSSKIAVFLAAFTSTDNNGNTHK